MVFLFEKGSFAEKRLLCKTVLKRLSVKENEIANMELNSPFGLIASKTSGLESGVHGET